MFKGMPLKGWGQETGIIRITLLGIQAKQIEVFGEIARKGYIYRGLRPVYWCADCETALAEAEIEYQGG